MAAAIFSCSNDDDVTNLPEVIDPIDVTIFNPELSIIENLDNEVDVLDIVEALGVQTLYGIEYGGGFVFHVDETDGTLYVVKDYSSIGLTSWGDHFDLTTGALIGDGLESTQRIVEGNLNDNSSVPNGLEFGSDDYAFKIVADLEYQTYGIVPAKLSEEQGSFVWKHETENQCLNITYNKNSGIIEGFNFMGIRGRHIIAEKWIAEQKTLDFVIQNLGAMNFDPEFFTPFEIKAVEEYNRQFPNRMVELKTKKGLFSKIFNNLKTKTTHLTEAK